ncbi:MAG: 30S ribosomal protein S6 [archaeon]|nr:30S ribosomal protein S6 [archaeon]
MKLTVSDPKTKKAFSKALDNPGIFLGKKVGEEVELGSIGMEGYKAKITGGSDKQGFPMKSDLQGGIRKMVFMIDNKKHGSKKKVARRGNLISDEISQVNLKITKEGKDSLVQLLGSDKQKEEELSFKEKAVKLSLENVGTAAMAPPTKKGRH